MSTDLILNSTIAASFGQAIVYLFPDMDVASAICFGIGLILLIIEIFTPGFGLFGIAGVIMSIIGIVLRATAGGRGNPVFQVLLLLLLLIIICVLAFIIMAVSSKKGFLSKTPFIMKESAVSKGIAEGTADYTSLVGKQGRTLCALRPSGIAEIDGVRYDVIAEGEFVDADETVSVLRVEGVRIVVVKSKL